MSYMKDRSELSELRELLTEKCPEMGIDLVISAHNHFYARMKSLDGDGKPAQSRPVYLCQNSSSGSIYLDPCENALTDGREAVEVLRQDYHRVKEDSFLVETFDAVTGEVIDTVSLN